MRQIVVPVGVAGSGKTTLYKEKYSNFVRISADEIRKEINDDIKPNKETEQKVWNEVDRRLSRVMKEGKDIFFDNTNRSRRKRISLFKQAHAKQYEVKIIWFCLPFKKLIEQDRQRNSSVGIEIQFKQLCSIDVPIRGIDCDGLEIIKSDFERTNDIIEFASKFMSLNEGTEKRYVNEFYVPVNDLYHKESVFEHLQKAIELSENEQMKELARWHDIGKPFTKTFDPIKCRTHNYNHDVVSAYLFSAFHVMNDDFGKEQMKISQLIRWHMSPFNELLQKSKRLKEREHITSEMEKMLIEFNKIDIASATRM